MKDKIVVEELFKSFNGTRVLRGLDLRVPEGQTTVIIGRSGEGKSVLLKHMIGLLWPDRGRVLVDGEDICTLGGQDLNRVRRKFGMLFQQAALFDSMTVGGNVAFPLVEHTRLTRAQMGEVVREKLKLVGLEGLEGRMPSELSGGQRKRVGLARAIALEPEILLYDEPTTGLDPILSDAIDRLIRRMQERLRVTSVVISHDIAGAFKVAHRIAMLHEGKIIAEGTPEEIRESPHPVVRQFLAGSAEGPIRVG